MVDTSLSITERQRRFAQVVQFVRREVVRVRYRVDVAELLFARDPRRVDVLSQYSAVIAQLLKELLFDGIVLDLCRVLDRAEFRVWSKSDARNIRFPNASLGWIVSELKTLAPDDELVSRGLNKATEAAQSLIERRNEWISHNDQRTVFSKSAISDVPYSDIRATIEACFQAIGHIPDHLQPIAEPEDMFGSPDLMEPGVLDFLRALHLGNQAYSAHIQAGAAKYFAGDDNGDPEGLKQVEPWLRLRRYGG